MIHGDCVIVRVEYVFGCQEGCVVWIFECVNDDLVGWFVIDELGMGCVVFFDLCFVMNFWILVGELVGVELG